MISFLRDTRGNASLWAAFIAIILCILSVLVYTGAMLYSTYQTAQTELERAANISVDDSLFNKNVRDLLLNIPAADSIEKINDSLIQKGYVQNSDGDWERTENGKICYSLKDLQITVSGEMLNITATVSMPMPWVVGNISSVNIPIHVESKVLYID